MTEAAKADALSGAGQALYARARRIIPGGTQLLSKRPELFLPEQWPSYYSRAEGAAVWGLDGRRYIDFTHCGVGTCILGFADPEINAAVVQAVQSGSMSTLNPPEEVELAELLVELHPWAEMVRFARAGGEAMAIAVRIARAATGRNIVAFCGYHGWSDWYLAANLADRSNLDAHMLAGLSPAGVPDFLKGSALPFRYNRLDELEAAVSAAGGNLAAIVMEPRRDVEPEPGFLAAVRRVADRTGAVLVFDEVTAGWRMALGGLHLTMGVEPDMAVFAKAMSNGYAMAAIIGRAAVMQAAQESFISSAYWTERIGPAAALATIHKMRRECAAERLIGTGERLRRGWLAAGAAAGLDVKVSGIPPLGGFRFDSADGNAMLTLFTQEMLARGYLASSAVYVMLTHTDELVDRYLENVAEVFRTIAAAGNDVAARLRGPVRHAGFQRLN